MLNGLGALDEGDVEWDIERRSSTVRELGFYCCHLDFEDHAKLIRACRSLRRVVSNSSDDGLKILQLLAEECFDSIEEPMLQLLDTQRIDVEILASFTKLRIVQGLTVGELVVSGNDENTELLKFQDFLPTSIESIQVQILQTSLSGPPLDDGLQDALFRAILDIASDERFTELEVVCLYGVFGGVAFQRHEDDYAQFSEQNASRMHEHERHEGIIRQIEESGVALHLRNASGELMSHEEHIGMHKSFFCIKLTEIETDPRPRGERD